MGKEKKQTITDLSNMVPKETSWFNLLHPVTKTELGGGERILVHGADSKRFNAAKHAIKNRLLRKRTTIRTAEEIEHDRVELLVACTEAWENIEWQGKPLECTPENVRMLYKKVSWIRDQVDDAMGDDALFFD